MHPELERPARERVCLPFGCTRAHAGSTSGAGIGSYEERKTQSLLLKAAKKLIADGRLPNIHCLFVGEGPDKEMLAGMITELGISANVTLESFTKEPFYVFERCNVIALPSTGKEGLPNVLLEALAMETPCVATNKYGMPEVVIDGKTGCALPTSCYR